VRTSVHNDTVVVTALGDVDAARVPRVLAALVAALAERPSKRVVLDLSKVTFLGSHGLAMLVDISTRAAQQGVLFRLVVGDRHTVIRALDVTGIAAGLTLYPSLSEAVTQP
jgi:anti-sigma B factor antagonist